MNNPMHETVIRHVYALSAVLNLPVIPIQEVEINTQEQ
jgi:hypothetical protein